ncbi:hypothetical protein BGZ72_003088 [Mortierella alpina]|nr:hypothetical protein BGZ72_003088 [Mortierella alpina]
MPGHPLDMVHDTSERSSSTQQSYGSIDSSLQESANFSVKEEVDYADGQNRQQALPVQARQHFDNSSLEDHREQPTPLRHFATSERSSVPPTSDQTYRQSYTTPFQLPGAIESARQGQVQQLKTEQMDDNEAFDSSLAMVLDDHLSLMDHLDMMPDIQHPFHGSDSSRNRTLEVGYCSEAAPATNPAVYFADLAHGPSDMAAVKQEEFTDEDPMLYFDVASEVQEKSYSTPQPSFGFMQGNGQHIKLEPSFPEIQRPPLQYAEPSYHPLEQQHPLDMGPIDMTHRAVVTNAIPATTSGFGSKAQLSQHQQRYSYGSSFPSPTKSQIIYWPTKNSYPSPWSYPPTSPTPPLKPETYPDSGPAPPIMYIPQNYLAPLRTLLIVAIVFIALGLVACGVSCYRGSRARKAREAAAALPVPNGPPMHPVPLTITQVQAGLVIPAGLQSFPIYVTNQRDQNGEELVLVPRRILQQQQSGPLAQGMAQLPMQQVHPSKDQGRQLEEEKHIRSLEAIRQSSGAYLGQEGSGVGGGGGGGGGVVPSSSTLNRGELLLQKPYLQQRPEHERAQGQKQTQNPNVQEQPQGQQQLPQSAPSPPPSSSSSSSAALQSGPQTHVVVLDVPDEEEEDEWALKKTAATGPNPSSEK